MGKRSFSSVILHSSSSVVSVRDRPLGSPHDLRNSRNFLILKQSDECMKRMEMDDGTQVHIYWCHKSAGAHREYLCRRTPFPTMLSSPPLAPPCWVLLDRC